MLKRAEALYEDVDLSAVRDWKASHPGRPAVGYLPIYVPREVVHAAGALPVAIRGGGTRVETVKGDAYFQSYICHLPRSVVDMGLSGRFDELDGFLFPAICDVIRNLSGIWQVLFPQRYVRYLDFPQTVQPEIALDFYRAELAGLFEDVKKLAGTVAGDADLARSIDLYDANRREVAKLLELRSRAPWLAPGSEVHLILRAGDLLPVEEHTRMIATYRSQAEVADRAPLDQARIVVIGAFCEQPPIGLVRTLERAGCAIVWDDMTLISHWHSRPVGTQGDPMTNLARAYLEDRPDNASVFAGDKLKGEELIRTCAENRADGVVFASPSFCDPSLLDRPMLSAALDDAGIPHTSIKYAENTAQFAELAEQAGTFSDTLKLWAEEVVR